MIGRFSTLSFIPLAWRFFAGYPLLFRLRKTWETAHRAARIAREQGD